MGPTLRVRKVAQVAEPWQQSHKLGTEPLSMKTRSLAVSAQAPPTSLAPILRAPCLKQILGSQDPPEPGVVTVLKNTHS